MKFVAITIQGIEDVVSKELKDMINVNSEIVADARVMFEANLEDVKKFIYMTRSCDRIYLLYDKLNFVNIEDIKKKVKSMNFEISGSFKVRCFREGEHEFNSQDVEKSVGGIIHEKGYNVDLTSPDATILVDLIDNLCFIGKYITNKELHKRVYRVKLHTKTINPLIAYAMIRLSGWKKNQTLLDPFAKDGIIPIEAAQYAFNFPRGYFRDEIKFDELNEKIIKKKLNVFCYDSLMQNVKTCEIHAKLAEVVKFINLGRYDIEWLDTKFKEGEIDYIITHLPFVSLKRDQSKVQKLIKETFSQAEYILNNLGKIVVFTPRPVIVKKIAKKFKIESERDIIIGDSYFSLIIFVKS